MDFEGDFGSVLNAEESEVHRVGHGDHFAAPGFDGVAEHDHSAVFACDGTHAEEVGAYADEAGFLFEFTKRGLIGRFAEFDESAGEGPKSFSWFNGALNHEEFAVVVGEKTAGGGGGIGIVESFTGRAVRAHTLPVVSFDEGASTDGAMVPFESRRLNSHDTYFSKAVRIESTRVIALCGVQILLT